MISPQTFRKKPVEIQAVQWDNEQDAPAIAEWCDGEFDANFSGATGPNGEDWGDLSIDTLEGTMQVSPHDWVIRGLQGEFYPCKPDIFAASYQAVSPK